MAKVKTLTPPPPLKVIGVDELNQLREEFERIQLCQAELEMARSNFKLVVTKIFIEKHCNPEREAFCLDCGVIHKIGNPKCDCGS
jgi:hypothetical protein